MILSLSLKRLLPAIINQLNIIIMKRFLLHRKGVLALLLALFAGMGTAYAYDFSATCSTGQTLYYNITDASQHYVEITRPGGSDWNGFVKPTGNITLPSTVNYNGVTYVVKAIGYAAFKECGGLRGSLTIPNSVTTISHWAFTSCSGFRGTLTIPSSVTELGNSAFMDCSGFAYVDYNATNCADPYQYNTPFENCGGTLTIGNNVTRIPSYMFQDSDFTGSLTIPNSVTTIGDGAFYNCTGFTGSLTIPNSVTTIGNGAFYNCTGFTGSLTLSNSLSTIGDEAFRGCSGFTGNLTIPNSVTTIDRQAFHSCSGFTGSLSISNSVTTIGDGAFGNCRGFTGSLTIPNSVTTIGVYAFGNCEGFNGSLTIGNSVSSIGYQAFFECSGFTGSLIIQNSVTELGDYAFYRCSGFNGSLSISNSLGSIGVGTFSGCSGLTGSLTIPNSVTEIGNSAFTNCIGFTGNLIIPNSVTSISNYAFSFCSGFTGSLTIPNSVSSIGNCAFEGCSGLTGSLSISNSVTTISLGAFLDCSGFTGSLTIPNSVTEVGEWAFYGCSGFTGSLILGNSLTTIGKSAFNNCNGFTSITVLPETPPTLGENVFMDLLATTPVIVPCGTLSAYQSASGWNAFTNMQQDCDPLTYSINEDGVSVTVTGHVDGTAATGELFIPETKIINGVTYTVTKIGNSAFDGCSGLTGSLTIPNTVTTIGDNAFYNCSGFTGSLTIGNSVTTIGDAAFDNCSGFTGSLTIPNSVTAIGYAAFFGCSGFTGSLTIPNSVTEVDEWAFFGCSGFNGSLSIGNSVRSIGFRAFYGCSGFTGTLTIGNSVTEIGEQAFCDCSGFTGSLTIPNTVTTIGDDAFLGCSGFTGSLTIPNAVTSIGNYAFYNCRGFTGSLTLSSSLVSIGNRAFFNCGFTGTLTLPNSLTTIDQCAFNHNNFTGSLTIPNSVTTIGDRAFEYCPSLTGTLTIGTGVTSMGAGAFRNSTGFTQVKYNAINCANLTANDKPFEGCGGTLTIGSSVARIPAYMFYRCTGFTGSLTIPYSVASIGESAFYGCSGFTGSLTIPGSVTTIGISAFDGCTGFTGSLSIGSSVTSIGAWAFYNTNFTGSLTIPNSVTSIGYYAFYSCGGFTGSLTLGNSVITIGSGAFAFCSGFTGNLVIPNSVTTIGDDAFYNCQGFTGSLTIGNAVTSIETYAFGYCKHFSSITVLPETPPSSGSSVFYEVPKTIPVNVPCGSLTAYQSASGWSDFTNYNCLPMTVTVTVIPTTGGTVSGGGTFAYGDNCTVTANPNSNYLFMHWSKNGTVVNCNTTYSFYVYQDADLEAVFLPQSSIGDIIGEGETNNAYLPSYSLYNYSLTEQIYTADELGGSFTINSISFFNAGNTKTRTYDIYLKHTTKTVFGNTTDWVSASSSNKVYSGSVTMTAGMWTTIVLDTPFAYNGSSNLMLIIDDNTGTWNGGMSCRVYNAQGNQALRIYSDDTNYNPATPSSYTGTLMNVKNQIMFNRPQVYDIVATSANTAMGRVSGGGTYGNGDLCRLRATALSGFIFTDWTDNNGTTVSTDANYTFTVTTSRSLTANFIAEGDYCNLTFDLHDSYGDGWNGNYLVASDGYGLSYQLAVPSNEHDASFTLPFEDGSHIELSWINGSYMYECSFEVRYSNENLIYAGRNLYVGFEYEFDMDCSEMSSSEWVYIGNNSTAANNYLPSYSYFNYGLSEQIYTADEIGTSGNINGIAFYNEGETKTRTYNIYLKTTDKTEFADKNDWISASMSDKVYGGVVTMVSGTWTPIFFDVPFEYNGFSNLVLIVDDNTGEYTSLPSMACRIFETRGIQALRIYGDATDFLPGSPSTYNGVLQTVKNQILLDITPATCSKPFDLNASSITYISADISWKSIGEERIVYDFEDGTLPDGWTTIDADGDGYTWMVNTEWGGHYGSTGMVNSSSYTNGTVLYPDNYLVSPQIQLGGSISFWACAQDASYAADHFGVAVSITGNTNASDFTTIREWTMTAKGAGAKVDSGTTRSGNRSQGTWYQYTVDLSAYAGQMGYVAIRHFNCSDMYYINVDDISFILDGSDNNFEIQYRECTPDNDFEGGFLHWTTIDADGDGYDWVPGSNSIGIYYTSYNLTGHGHYSSNDMAVSGSYSQLTGVLTPDNYLVSPQIQLGGSISFWACAQDDSWAAEHFGVAVSTSGNTNASDFTTIQEWTMTAKGTGAKVNPEATRSGSREQGTWYRYTVDLSAYAGQMGYVAIRHFGCTDQFLLLIDDITIEQPGINSNPTWSSVSNVVSPCTITGFRSGATYLAQVRPICDIDSYGEWSEPVFFTTVAGNVFFIDGNWNVGANWANGTVPAGNDVDVVIAADAIIPAGYDAVVNNIEILGSNSITIKDGGQLHSNVSVLATVEKNISGYGEGNGNWYLISIPHWGSSPNLSNVIGLLPTELDNIDLYAFDGTQESEEWRNHKANAINYLGFGKGYLYANANDVILRYTTTVPRQFYNFLYVNGGTSSSVLNYDTNAQGGSWNLVGSPLVHNGYLYLGVVEGGDVTVIPTAYYQMNETGTELIASDGEVSPFEGVLIQATDAEQYAFVSSVPHEAKSGLDINVAQENSVIDRALIRFGEGSGLYKFQLNPNHSKVYMTEGDKDYAMVFANGNDEVSVSFKAEKDGTYTMSFTNEGVTFSYLHLIDNATGEDIDLLAALRPFDGPQGPQGPASYTFEAKTTDNADRFMLIYSVESK